MAHKTSENEKKNKSLVAPLVAVGASVGGWLYGLSQNVLETFRSIFNGSAGTGTSLDADSAFEAGSSITSTDTTAMLIIVVALIILTIIGIIGIIAFFKHLIGRFVKTEKKEEKKEELAEVKPEKVESGEAVVAETVPADENK